MKFIIGLALLLVSSAAFADTLDTKSFIFNGDEQSFALRAEETHTEYRYDTVARTCWRDDFAGYRRECYWHHDRQCHNERECRVVNGHRECYDRPVCRDYGHQVCRDVPYYRRVAYTCYEQIRTPFEVRDFDVNAHVRVALDSALSQRALTEPMKLELKGDQLRLLAPDTRGRWVLFFQRGYHENLAGGLKTIDAEYTIHPVGRAAFDLPMSSNPTDVKVEADEFLSFKSPGLLNPEFFDVRVEVKKTKFLASEKIVDTVLPATAFAATRLGNLTEMRTRLADLGWDPRTAASGTYKMEVTLLLRVDRAAVLNEQVLPKKTEVTGTGKYKIKR